MSAASPSQVPDAAGEDARIGRDDPVRLARAIVEDTQLLFVKHLELAREEIAEAVEARIQAAVAGAAAGVLALFALGFLASAGAYALDQIWPAWLSRLVVAGGFLVITAVVAIFGRSRMLSPPFAPEQTKQMLEEDREWIRSRLER